MKAIRVFQDGKRCADYKIGNWKSDTFLTKSEAELFAAHWAYPVSAEQAKDFVRPMEFNVPIDMGISEVPVMMEIREIETDDDFEDMRLVLKQKAEVAKSEDQLETIKLFDNLLNSLQALTNSINQSENIS